MRQRCVSAWSLHPAWIAAPCCRTRVLTPQTMHSLLAGSHQGKPSSSLLPDDTPPPEEGGLAKKRRKLTAKQQQLLEEATEKEARKAAGQAKRSRQAEQETAAAAARGTCTLVDGLLWNGKLAPGDAGEIRCCCWCSRPAPEESDAQSRHRWIASWFAVVACIPDKFGEFDPSNEAYQIIGSGRVAGKIPRKQEHAWPAAPTGRRPCSGCRNRSRVPHPHGQVGARLHCHPLHCFLRN